LKQDISTGYAALRTAVGIVDRSHLGRVLVTGSDRRSYLHGLLTNDIESLTAGTGCYAALLTPQGRMLSDMRVWELGDAILIDLPRSATASIAAHLERFVFSEDVQVRDVTEELRQIGLFGPRAAELVRQLLDCAEEPGQLPLYGSTRCSYGAATGFIVRSDDVGVAGFDLITKRMDDDTLLQSLMAAGAVLVEPEAAETIRIEDGRPRFGVDMDEHTIPLEAGIEDLAISRTKGCYVGQEVIVRVLDRGHGRVARRLVGLSLTPGAPVPPTGAAIRAADRDIGRVTSATYSLAMGRAIALGYVQRDFTAPETPLNVADSAATVVTLPFVKVESSA
jgi:folate-binding protein YgfZ